MIFTRPSRDTWQPSREVARLWNVVQAKGREDKAQGEPMEIMKKSPMKQEWLLMIKARNLNAVALTGTQAAMVTVTGMREGIQTRIYQQADNGQKLAAQTLPRVQLAKQSYQRDLQQPEGLKLAQLQRISFPSRKSWKLLKVATWI